MKITDALLAEHVVFHALFDHIERATPQLKTLGEVRALAELLEGMLVQHSKSEDELLMHYLEDSIEQMGQRDTFHDEHELIEQQQLSPDGRVVARGDRVHREGVGGNPEA